MKISQKFQSSIAPKDDRNVGEFLAIAALLVSILDRPEGRPQPGLLPTLSTVPRCFNPRSPRRTTATGIVRDTLSIKPVVSILDRPEGRPQPERALMVNKPKVSILDRPEGRPQLSLLLFQLIIFLFQSSIAPKDDRNIKSSRITGENVAGFNPRSPRRTTATVEQVLSADCFTSFNPRSPRRTTATAIP